MAPTLEAPVRFYGGAEFISTGDVIPLTGRKASHPSTYRLPVDFIASRKLTGSKLIHFDQDYSVVLIDSNAGSAASNMPFQSLDLVQGIEAPRLARLINRLAASLRCQHLDYVHLEDPWESIQKEIRSFAHLAANWDSHGSPAIGEKAIAAALAVMDAAAQSSTCSVAWAKPTSDESILMQLALSGGGIMKFEVDRDGDIGVMVEKTGQPPEFLDLLPEQLMEFFEEQENGTHD